MLSLINRFFILFCSYYFFMAQSNQDIIRQFFEAYGKRDMEDIKLVMDNRVQWTIPGHHPLSGIKTGIDEVIALFDAMGSVMSKSNIRVENLVTGENDDYVVECQHIITNREDGNNLDHYWSVLWTFKNGKIMEGRHLASDQHAADSFFCKALLIS
jgi:ketosteroid isomerase-like protein